MARKKTTTAAKKPRRKAMPKAKRSRSTKAKPKAKAKVTRRKMTGLRKPQIAILAALATTTRALSVPEVVAIGKPSVYASAWPLCVGSLTDEIRLANDKAVFPSLLSLGLVKASVHDRDGRDVVCWSCTPAGRKAVKAAVKERDAKAAAKRKAAAGKTKVAGKADGAKRKARTVSKANRAKPKRRTTKRKSAKA